LATALTTMRTYNDTTVYRTTFGEWQRRDQNETIAHWFICVYQQCTDTVVVEEAGGDRIFPS
jgi:hypothetical protein